MGLDILIMLSLLLKILTVKIMIVLPVTVEMQVKDTEVQIFLKTMESILVKYQYGILGM